MRDAEYGSGRLTDLAQAELVAVVPIGQTNIVVVAVDECERQKSAEPSAASNALSDAER